MMGYVCVLLNDIFSTFNGIYMKKKLDSRVSFFILFYLSSILETFLVSDHLFSFFFTLSLLFIIIVQYIYIYTHLMALYFQLQWSIIDDDDSHMYAYICVWLLLFLDMFVNHRVHIIDINVSIGHSNNQTNIMTTTMIDYVFALFVSSNFIILIHQTSLL